MADNSCEYIIGFDGDPILCDRPAPINHGGFWYCAEHYDATLEDEREAFEPKSRLDNKPFS